MQIDIPGYKIISTLGQGGMATVYLAIQTCFEREVALKVMSPHLSSDPSFGERFLREARIVSRLMHPNIVTVYDVGIHEGLYYLSMEYLPGRDLKHKRFELNLIESLSVVKDIARALDYAGRKGYVHRDVKPENIMLLDEGGRAVLMDFGIARPSDVASGMTQTGTAIGTPHYMSPEQAKGVTVDSRADLYSLGVVLFVLLTGRVPFDADSAVVVGIKHVSEAVPRLPEHLQVFQPIIDRVMAKDPSERYQTGSELIADLDAITSAQILAAMKAEDFSLDADGGQALSPTMVNPEPMLTGEQIISHHPSADTGSLSVNKAELDVYDAAISEAFSVSEEDRADHRHHPSIDPPAKSNAWMGFVVLLLVIGVVFYFRADMRQYWQDYGKPLLARDTPTVIQPTQPEQSTVASESGAPNTRETPSLPSPVLFNGEPAEQPADLPAVVENPDLVQQAQALREQLVTDPDIAPALALMYRAALVDPDPEVYRAGQEGLQELQNFYAGSIYGALDADNLMPATTYAEMAQSLFDEPERNTALIDALSRWEKHALLDYQLHQAHQYLRAGVLDEPAGDNALDTYRAVLEEHPDNQAAKAGIQQVAQAYGQSAQEQAAKGAPRAALALVDKGLLLSPDNAELLQQKTVLRAQEQHHQEQEKQLASKAESQHMAGRVIAPPGDNAFETYSEILARDSTSKVGRDGLVRIEHTLTNNIQGLIERHRLLDATSAIASARERFPHSKALLALKVRAEQLLEENKPDIVRMIISNREIADIEQAQRDTVPADRVIFIGFEYRNFKDGTSVLHAVLYDGARSLQMAQVPVIVSGSSGVQYFRIEQPISGFSEGGYHVDLILDNETLMSTAFSVKK